MGKQLENNLKKCDELDPSIREPTKEAVRSAFDKNMTFTISETRRTYERQCLLLSQGRTRSDIMRNVFPYGFKLNAKQMADMMKIYDEGRNLQGEIVTYTLNSDHLDGKAMDIYPINTSYSELALHFIRWDIKQPYLFESAHFSVASARSIEPVMNITPLERLKRLKIRLKNVIDPMQKTMLENLIHRFSARLGL